MTDQVVYRYKPSDDGSFLSGVPRRDLTARDLQRLRGRIADVKASPLYAAVQSEPAKAAREAGGVVEAESPAKGKKGGDA